MVPGTHERCLLRGVVEAVAAAVVVAGVVDAELEVLALSTRSSRREGPVGFVWVALFDFCPL